MVEVEERHYEYLNRLFSRENFGNIARGAEMTIQVSEGFACEPMKYMSWFEESICSSANAQLAIQIDCEQEGV